MSDAVTCAVYRSARQEGLYLFVPRPDDFSRVPAPLLSHFGKPELAMTLELTPERTLARSDAREVLRNLAGQGYHLQMPPRGVAPGQHQPFNRREVEEA